LNRSRLLKNPATLSCGCHLGNVGLDAPYIFDSHFLLQTDLPGHLVRGLACFLAIPLLAAQNSGGFPPVLFLIMPALMMAFGYFIIKKLIFDLVDEVLDDGDALVIRNGREEERVPLSDIMNVSYSQFVSPPRVTLSLRNSSRFGNRISFCAPIRLMPFSTSPVIDELIERIDAKRRAR
jgi:hypothetical protein